MKKFFAMFFVLFLCSCNTGQGTSEVPENKPFGWRSAGLTPNADSLNKWGNGYMDIVHSGKYIFVRDGKVANTQTLEPNRRIFMSMQGSNTWEEIQTPDGMIVFTVYADEFGLYVGTYNSGQVWHYDPSAKKWTELSIQIETPELNEFRAELTIYGIARFKGQLIVCIGDYVDKLKYTVAFMLLLQSDGTWKDISPPDNYSADAWKLPFHFSKAVEWRDKLFAINNNVGTWVYDGSQWEKLPYPEGLISGHTNEPYDAPHAVAVHKDRLYTGQYSYGGVHELQDDYSWVRVDSNTATDGSYYYNTPWRIKTLVSTGEHLLVAGIGPGGIPQVYMGDKGDPKGWRSLRRGWCDNVRCIATETYGLDVVGDTLYAATWSGMFKFPLSDLDSAIAGENSYYKED